MSQISSLQKAGGNVNPLLPPLEIDQKFVGAYCEYRVLGPNDEIDYQPHKVFPQEYWRRHAFDGCKMQERHVYSNGEKGDWNTVKEKASWEPLPKSKPTTKKQTAKKPATKKSARKSSRPITSLQLSQIYANPDQPRKHFDGRALADLRQSIEEMGLLEPIVVTRRKDGYMIIAGERRWRASIAAGLKSVPVRHIKASNQQVAELSLLENLQREDLNPIEEAKAYRSLMDMGLSMDELAKKMGFRQTWRIRERTDLLGLKGKYQVMLTMKFITRSQATELARLPEDKQDELYAAIKLGKCDSYNKLRAVTNAILSPPPKQTGFDMPEMSDKEKKVGRKYDKMLERVAALVKSCLNKDDLEVLPKVINSTLDVNIQTMDIILKDLQKIKQVMVVAQAAKDAGKAAR